MFRFLLAIAMAALLAACEGLGEEKTAEPSLAGEGGVASPPAIPSPSPEATFDVEPSVPASPDVSPGSGTGTGTAETCDDAWARLAGQNLSSTSELAELTDEVEATIAACETVAEWVDGAQTVVDDIDTSSAEFFLRMRCEEQALSDTPLCEELMSS
jgi:hypothetical protein